MADFLDWEPLQNSWKPEDLKELCSYKLSTDKSHFRGKTWDQLNFSLVYKKQLYIYTNWLHIKQIAFLKENLLSKNWVALFLQFYQSVVRKFADFPWKGFGPQTTLWEPDGTWDGFGVLFWTRVGIGTYLALGSPLPPCHRCPRGTVQRLTFCVWLAALVHGLCALNPPAQSTQGSPGASLPHPTRSLTLRWLRDMPCNLHLAIPCRQETNRPTNLYLQEISRIHLPFLLIYFGYG